MILNLFEYEEEVGYFYDSLFFIVFIVHSRCLTLLYVA